MEKDNSFKISDSFNHCQFWSDDIFTAGFLQLFQNTGLKIFEVIMNFLSITSLIYNFLKVFSIWEYWFWDDFKVLKMALVILVTLVQNFLKNQYQKYFNAVL